MAIAIGVGSVVTPGQFDQFIKEHKGDGRVYGQLGLKSNLRDSDPKRLLTKIIDLTDDVMLDKEGRPMSDQNYLGEKIHKREVEK